MYVSDTRFLKELIKGLNIGENIIIHEIVDYLDFLKNVMPFELPYFLLQKNLELYLLHRGITTDGKKNYFCFAIEIPSM